MSPYAFRYDHIIALKVQIWFCAYPAAAGILAGGGVGVAEGRSGLVEGESNEGDEPKMKWKRQIITHTNEA